MWVVSDWAVKVPPSVFWWAHTPVTDGQGWSVPFFREGPTTWYKYTHMTAVRHFLLVIVILQVRILYYCNTAVRLSFFYTCTVLCVFFCALIFLTHRRVSHCCIWGPEYAVTVKTSFLNLSRRADSNHVQYSYHTTMKKNNIFLYSLFSVFGFFF